MKIVFYANRTHINGNYLETRGLGGSESALINLSRALKENFNEVEIIIYNGSRPKPELYDGILYKSAKDFMSDCKTFKASVLISLRDTIPFTLPYVDARFKILWSQDDKHELELQSLQQKLYARENTDAILAISNYAASSIHEMFPEKKIYLQRNGYNSKLVESGYSEDRKPICVYTSTPYRGLDVLDEIWPNIYNGCKEKNIIPELWVFGDMSLYNWSNQPFESLFSHIKTLKGTKVFGSVCQKDLYAYLKQTKVMTYPNHFLETGAMSVLEAIACGNWIVTTDLGALGEQVIDGMNGNLISGDSRSEEYKKIFIKLTIDALSENKIPKQDEKIIFSWNEQAKNLMKILIDLYKS